MSPPPRPRASRRRPPARAETPSRRAEGRGKKIPPAVRVFLFVLSGEWENGIRQSPYRGFNDYGAPFTLVNGRRGRLATGGGAQGARAQRALADYRLATQARRGEPCRGKG
eukprot:scaffold212203_cov33-Tisochrysis_lutea.AAC.2